MDTVFQKDGSFCDYGMNTTTPGERPADSGGSILAESFFRCETVQHGFVPPMWGRDFSERTLYDKVYVITAGAGTLNLNERTYALKPGRAFLFPANSIQTGSADPALGLKVLWTHFEAKTGDGFRLLDLAPVPECVRGAPAAEVESLMRELLAEWQARSPWRHLAAKALLPRLVLTFGRAAGRDVLPPDAIRRLDEVTAPAAGRAKRLHLIAKALRRIEADFAQPLTLEELAAETGLSPAYFCSLFRRLTGIPPMRHLEHRRIRRAQELLRNGDLPLVRIADAIGYPDPYYFSRVFRRVTGSSPSRYRQGRHAVKA
jgi:AraC-like DNA-binding protein